MLDWALLGIALALSGGAESWLLVTVPFLALGQLAGTSLGEWPFLVGPSLLLLVVLVIADPSLGGSRVGAVAKLAVLVAGGCVAATRLRRRPAARARQAHAPKVDVSTGLSTGTCLPGFLESAAATALAEHRPLSVVYVRLEHYEDSRNFLGAEGSEGLVRGVARRAERSLCADGRAFRVRPDGLVLVLPGLSLAEARQTASDLAREVGGSLIAGRRQTLATGAASFPTAAEHRGAARRRPGRGAPGGHLHRGGRHRRPAGGRSVSTRAATARVLPLPMRLASLRLWRSTSPASRCRRAWPSRSRYGSRGVRPAGCS